MSYDFFLGRLRLPVTPAKFQVKINGNNKTINLINESEINILKKAKLSDITFTALFPNMPHSFASYDGGFKDASFFLDELERLKTQIDSNGNLLPFQFIVSRALPNKVLFSTNMKVSLEDYGITDDAKNGFDVVVDVKLKQYKNYGTKLVEVVTLDQTTQVSVEPNRPAENPPTQSMYTVISGDTLWGITQKQLGNGDRYPEVYVLNRQIIDDGNQGTGNTKYTVYPGQVFRIPEQTT